MTSEERSWLRLHLTPGMGRAGIVRLMEAFGSPEEILAAPASWSAQARISQRVARALPDEDDPDFLKACAAIEKTGAAIIPLWDDVRYPDLLRAIHDPPALLYVRGELRARQALAVVGARRASPGGLRMTEEICAELAERGITIVSGLARGIDSAAHRGALAADGLTIGVLGCGIDRVYPPENARLFQQVLEAGALVSEYPPGSPPLAGHFPGRNRVISGLCRGVLVVEAAEESGSLITADFALEQGREVFAVPGSVASRTSSGVNRLLKEGAALVTEPNDILEALWPEVPTKRQQKEQESFLSTLTGDALALYQAISSEPLHIDEIARTSRLTPMNVSAILLTLELQGAVHQLPGMRYVRNGRD